MDKETATKILKEITGKKLDILDISYAGSGYHSNGYKIDTKEGKYFIKQIKSHDLGFEFPQRKLSALMISHAMNNRAETFPKSLGVVAHTGEPQKIPDIAEETIFYNVQEYGGAGKSYLEMLNERKEKRQPDQKDIEEIESIVEYITKIHSIRHPSKERKKLDAIYNDSIRSIIGHPELTLQLLHTFPKDAQILAPKDQATYLGLMLEQMHILKDRSERLTALHGDFWPSNAIFTKDDKLYFVDYSRIPWGDPGVDIGCWVSTYLFMWHNTANDYYRQLAEMFLKKYIEKTNDKEIVNVIPYSLSLIAIMYAHPTWVPGIRAEIRRKYYEHVVQMLERKEFFFPTKTI